MWIADKIYYQNSSSFTRAYQGSELVWDLLLSNTLKFTAKANSSSIGLANISTGQTIEYSTNGSSWTNMTTATTINLSSGDTVYIRGTLSSNNTTTNYTQFKMTGDIKASGNLNYLWNYQNPSAALKSYCGYDLFLVCSALSDASELILPSTSLSEGCYQNMFVQCINMITGPAELPATTLTTACYRSMFLHCSGLTEVPDLPATGLTNNCYRQYAQSTAIRTAPALPATTLAYECYRSMFKDCTGLTTAPELPAPTLTQSCYHYMFSGCTNLNYIKCLATDISASNCTTQWVAGVASSGTFVSDPNMYNWTIGVNGIPTGWVATNLFRLTAKANNSTVGLKKKSSYHTVQYSTNGSSWTNMTTATTVNLSSGDTIYIRGTLSSNNTPSNYTNFKFNGNIVASGNLNYLWNYSNPTAALKNYCGYFLFSDCTALTDASELLFPSTTLVQSCYMTMFQNCSGLTSVPSILPATTLADSCYRGMFQYTPITTAPELPATTLSTYCYQNMFRGCGHLNYIKCLATNISASNCTTQWVQNVAPTGTFVKASSMTGWTIDSINGIPIGWTVVDGNYLKFTAKANNSSVGLMAKSTGQTIEYSTDGDNWTNMTTATTVNLSNGHSVYIRGTLSSYNNYSNYTNFKMSGNIKASGNINYLWNKNNPDNALKRYCGCKLFANCTSLTDASELQLPTKVLTSDCYSSMFSGCTNLTTAPALPATTLAEACYYHMFYKCTSLTTAPTLPAEYINMSAYQGMFEGCTSLNYIDCQAKDHYDYKVTLSWVSGVAATGNFNRASGSWFWEIGKNGIPSGWTVFPPLH